MRPYHAMLGATIIKFIVAIAAIPVSFRIARTAVDPDAVEMIGFMLAIILLILSGVLAVGTAAIWSYEREKKLDDKLLQNGHR